METVLTVNRRSNFPARTVLATLITLLLSFGSASFAQETEAADQSDAQRFLSYLRANFEDIHEVSMRYHMTDPSIGGLIVLQMEWEGGKMLDGRVIENETTSQEEGAALLDAIRKWRIDGITGPSTLEIPFRIKLVGSDDPTFPDRGILTGSVRAVDGSPIHQAQVRFSSSAGSDANLRPARTNREGVFIRTLVEPGTWDLECSAEGFEPVRISAVAFGAGTHHIRHFTLKPIEKKSH